MPDVQARHRYCVYGVGIASDAPLDMPAYSHEALCHVACHRAPASVFADANRRAIVDRSFDAWHRYATLPDGSTYARWNTVGEFLVAADGREMLCRPVDEASLEAFQVYLLGQALSDALVKQHFEPLHATVIVTHGRGIALLGGNAYGKSTLAAAFLEAGDRLLTDDVLVIRETKGSVLAYPGPPRLKVFPSVARRFLGRLPGPATMNANTDKLILPIGDRQSWAEPAPLVAIYSLAAPRDSCRQSTIAIDRLSPRDAFAELVKNAFNRRLVDRARRERQFAIMARLANRIAVKRLFYPRTLSRLDEVRRAVLDDVHGARRLQPSAD